MNVVELHQKLIAAAKTAPPAGGVPYAFEKRIMAHLRTAPTIDTWGQWAGALWRAAVPCVCLMLALSIWSMASTDTAALSTSTSALASVDLSQQMERTVLAAAEPEQGSDSTW